MAQQVQRGLRAGRARREEERLEHVLQRRVDLGAALGLMHHSPHLAADDVAGHEDPARAAQVERARKRRVVAGVQVEAIDQLQLIGIGLLDAVDPIDLRQLRQQVGRHVRGRASRDVVDERRLVGRSGDSLVVTLEPEAAGLVVVGRHRQHRVGAELGRPFCQVHGVARVVGAGAGDDRLARRALAHGQPDEPQLLLVGERRGLSG